MYDLSLGSELKTTIAINKPNIKLNFPRIFMLMLNVMTRKYALNFHFSCN